MIATVTTTLVCCRQDRIQTVFAAGRVPYRQSVPLCTYTAPHTLFEALCDGILDGHASDAFFIIIDSERDNTGFGVDRDLGLRALFDFKNLDGRWRLEVAHA